MINEQQQCTLSKLMRLIKEGDDDGAETESEKTMQKASIGGLELITYNSSIDGKLVLQIDTKDTPEDKDGPVLRVCMNDSTASKWVN